MYREKIHQLIKWQHSNTRKPLVLLGARQVGKTHLLKSFGNANYKQIAYINFEHPNAPKDLFALDFNHERIITILNAYCNIKIEATNTLIILDEIQSTKKGVTSLKYFQENAPEYHIVAAGSLLGVNIHPEESFPVGKVDFMYLYPMSFNEFLLAIGEDALYELLINKDFQSISFFHEKLINYVRYYLFVGGMPEAVKEFANTQDWNATRKIQNQIIQSYRNDFSKYAPPTELPRINMVWDSLPSQLAKENKKFIYGIIRKGARAKDFEIAIQWLTDTGLLHKVYNTSKPSLPLKAYQELSNFKLFYNDVGLLGAASQLSAKTIVYGNGIFKEFKGAMTEQFVFQQLLETENVNIYYHTFDGSKYELDFLLQDSDDEIIPVEVKSGVNVKSTSLKHFCERNKPSKAIRFSTKEYRKEDWLTNYPLYSVGSVFNVIE